MPYAQQTKVPVEKSKAEIELLVTKYGATSFLRGWSDGATQIAFEMEGRRVIFRMQDPQESIGSPRHVQEMRRRWRALLLTIKGKLITVESGISTFDQEFMAQIATPDGLTVGDHMVPRIESMYDTGKMPKLMLPLPQ